jgi:hypothetical protein
LRLSGLIELVQVIAKCFVKMVVQTITFRPKGIREVRLSQTFQTLSRRHEAIHLRGQMYHLVDGLGVNMPAKSPDCNDIIPKSVHEI